MADTIYPDNKLTGTSFDSGLDGWTAFSNTCTLLFGLIPTNDPLTCRTDTTQATDIAGTSATLTGRVNARGWRRRSSTATGPRPT